MHRSTKAKYAVIAIGYISGASLAAVTPGCVAADNPIRNDLGAASSDSTRSGSDGFDVSNDANGTLRDGPHANVQDSKSDVLKADQAIAKDQSYVKKDASIDNGTDGPCTQNCTNRQCGPDPVCDISCGICNTGLPCSGAGQCAAPTCKANAPRVADMKTDASHQESSIALDSQGAAHSIYLCIAVRHEQIGYVEKRNCWEH